MYILTVTMTLVEMHLLMIVEFALEVILGIYQTLMILAVDVSFNQLKIFNVFNPHHPCADHSKSNFFSQGKGTPSDASMRLYTSSLFNLTSTALVIFFNRAVC